MPAVHVPPIRSASDALAALCEKRTLEYEGRSRLPERDSVTRVTQDRRPDSKPRGGPAEVFRAFLKLGVTSFGGPTAHIGYFRDELVVRRKWVSEKQYAELVALCQFLPGPASSQVGFALGLIRGGVLGALAAWAGFTLPSAGFMVLVAIGAIALDGVIGQGLLLGLNAVAVAVVALAVAGMARTLTPDLRRILIGVVAAGICIFIAGNLGQLAAMGIGIAAGMVWCRASSVAGTEPLHVPVSRRVGLVALSLFGVLLAGLPLLARLTQNLWVEHIDAFYRAGALVFGGGHVVLPLLQAEPAIASAVTPEQFLAGYGAAQALPGPLFAFSAYLGFEMAPGVPALASALLALIAIFVPGLLLLTAALPFWNRLRRSQKARSAIAGANAAVVGILAAALWNPVVTSGITSVASLCIALACLLILVTRKVPVWVTVLAGAAAGAVVNSVGIV